MSGVVEALKTCCVDIPVRLVGGGSTLILSIVLGLHGRAGLQQFCHLQALVLLANNPLLQSGQYTAVQCNW